MLARGSEFAGRYRVVRLLAKGGMGAVYAAVHLETDRECALKVLHDSSLRSPDLRERFRREARVTARIRSEFIVDVLDAGVDDASGSPYLVMEFLHGEELGERLRRLGRFEPSQVVLYLSQVAIALDKTHAASVVHRDLKPANLFLTHRDDGSPVVKILDFGIAKAVLEGDVQTTQSIGTPLYMAPEQLRGGSAVSAASDVYALGMVAYSLLVGKPYWQEERDSSPHPVAFAMQTLSGPRFSPRVRANEAGVALPEGFDDWFFTACDPEPSKRFGSASVAVTKLAEVLGEAEALPKFPSLPPPSSSPAGRSGPTEAFPTVLDPTPVRLEIAPLTAGEGLVTSATRITGPTAPPPRRLRLALGLVALSIGALLAIGLKLLAPQVAVSSNQAAAPSSAGVTRKVTSAAAPSATNVSATATSPPSALPAVSATSDAQAAEPEPTDPREPSLPGSTGPRRTSSTQPPSAVTATPPMRPAGSPRPAPLPTLPVHSRD